MSWLEITAADAESGSVSRTVRTADIGISVFDINEDAFPTRDVTMISVPGRSGDLTIDNGRWNNKDVTFHCLALSTNDSGVEKASRFLNGLATMRGYLRIRNGFEENRSREGVFQGGTITEKSKDGSLCKFRITFRCKPQKFYYNWGIVNGSLTNLDAVTLAAPDSVGENGVANSPVIVQISNPTDFAAAPKLWIYGTGSGRVEFHDHWQNVTSVFLVNNQPVNVGHPDSAILILDCETMEVYRTATDANANSAVSLSQWPKLTPGHTDVYNYTNAKITIEPRWWTL